MDHERGAAPAEVTPAPSIESPALIWWISIPAGMGLTALLALSPAAHAWLPSPLDALLPVRVVQGIFYLAVFAHALEGSYAAFRARASGLPMARWGGQTLLLGYPSLRLLLRRTRAASHARTDVS